MSRADPFHDLRRAERAACHVHPGGWAVEPALPLATLLGSCVAVCLYDPRLRLAGMNHFLLPSRAARPDDDPDVVLAGDYAMEVLVNAMLARGAVKRRLVAKAFGGGALVDAIRVSVGERNARFAEQWLACEGIPLLASDFGGAWSRKLLFLPHTGDAYCRRLPVQGPSVQRLLQEEKRYEQTLGRDDPRRRVEIF